MSKNIFAYVAASDPGSYPASVSHWLMAVANITADDGTITVDDWSTVIGNIQSANPGKPILLGIGGTDAHYTAMAANATYRANFLSNINSAIAAYGFDGVVIDWEYPDTTSQGANFVTLLGEIKAGLATGKLLGYAAGNYDTFPTYVDVPTTAGYVDFIFLMGYDYNWSTLGHHSQLYLSEIFATENNITYKMTGDNMVSLWAAEIPSNKDKIILGLPFYGYYYENSHQLLTYAQLVASYINLNDWIAYYDTVAEVPWLEKWISGDTYHHIFYENEESVEAKADYCISSGIGGLGIWLIEYDNSHDLLESMADILLFETIEVPLIVVTIAVLPPSLTNYVVINMPLIIITIAVLPPILAIASTDSEFTLLKFNLSNTIGKTIKKATLKLYIISYSNNPRLGIQRITGAWTEGAVTYNTRPAIDTEVYVSDVVITDTGWKAFDITDFVQDVADGATHNGMWISILNDISDYANCSFSSKEGTYPPVLDVYYTE